MNLPSKNAPSRRNFRKAYLSAAQQEQMERLGVRMCDVVRAGLAALEQNAAALAEIKARQVQAPPAPSPPVQPPMPLDLDQGWADDFTADPWSDVILTDWENPEDQS